MSIYESGLDRNPANHQPLTPLSFLKRAARVWPERTAVIHGDLPPQLRGALCTLARLASALTLLGVGRGDTVAVILPNIPAMLEAHYGVPMLGAVLNTINTRLDAATIAFQIDHGEAKVLIVDREFAALGQAALALATRKPILVECDDREFPMRPSRRRAPSPRMNTRRSSPWAIPPSTGSGRRTNGTRSRSTTPPARRATRRASSIRTAAPT